MALEEVASTLRSLAWGWIVVRSFFVYLASDVGVDDGLFVGVADEDFLRKQRMERRTTTCWNSRRALGGHYDGLNICPLTVVVGRSVDGRHSTTDLTPYRPATAPATRKRQ
jgi:hypothetical protein